jgi:hypothetical protein
VAIVGLPTEWVDLIDSMVPQILTLVVATWEEVPSPASDDKEDHITNILCLALQKNRSARGLPFQIRTQAVELEPMEGEGLGRMDIVFIPMVPREDIYFCLESKRLNAITNGKIRSYASEYVTFGMMRFVTGQYSKAVQHGGMIGYVLDGDVARAMVNVKANIKKQRISLRMAARGTFLPSTVLINDVRARETRHNRAHETNPFCIHHLFMVAHQKKAQKNKGSEALLSKMRS